VVSAAEDQSVLTCIVPDELGTGTYPVVVARGAQLSLPPGTEESPPPPHILFEVASGAKFGLDPMRSGGGLDFGVPDAEGLVYTVCKIGNLEPDYSSVVGTESLSRGVHTWEVTFDRIGNTRIGLARMPMALDCGLHSKDLRGEAWFLDYEGKVKHNRFGTLSTLKSVLPQNQEFASGDTVSFMLDLRDNSRYADAAAQRNPTGRGKLTITFKGRSFLAASDLHGEFWPIFNLDNVKETLTLDFVIDGNGGGGPTALARVLEVPPVEERDALFARMDLDGTGTLTVAEVSEAVNTFWPELRDSPKVVVMAHRAADNSGDGCIGMVEFRRLFQFLVFFTRLGHMFEQIDTSGDGRLTLAEFKAGAKLVEPALRHEDIEAGELFAPDVALLVC
jgi:hypothetical protein